MKNNNFFYLPFLVFFTLFMVSCTNDDKKEEVREDDNGISINVDDEDGKTNIKIGEDGIKIDINDGKNSIKIDADNLEETLKQFTNGKKVPVVDFREFKKLFPNKVAGIKRTSLEGSKTGFGNIKSSVASAEYKDGDTKIKISIIDSGGMGMAVTALAGWAGLEIDNESDHGYERTTTIDGYKAFTSYDTNDEGGQIALFAKDRIIYSVEVENGSEKLLKKASKAVDIDDIVDLLKTVE